MNNFPSKEIVARVRESFPRGCRVRLVRMNDPYSKLTSGDCGTVNSVDDTGTVHIRWDCGSHLGAMYGEDIIEKI